MVGSTKSVSVPVCNSITLYATSCIMLSLGEHGADGGPHPIHMGGDHGFIPWEPIITGKFKPPFKINSNVSTIIIYSQKNVYESRMTRNSSDDALGSDWMTLDRIGWAKILSDNHIWSDIFESDNTVGYKNLHPIRSDIFVIRRVHCSLLGLSPLWFPDSSSIIVTYIPVVSTHERTSFQTNSELKDTSLIITRHFKNRSSHVCAKT